MTIVEMKSLTGPNIWSARRGNLIHMLLDIGALEQHPSSDLPGFTERLMALLPGLYSHRCSEGREGGFLYRLQTGTWMGHVVEHVALELQTAAGMDTGWGRTRQSHQTGVYHVVYSYLDAEAGQYAGQCAVNLVTALINRKPYHVEEDIQKLKEIWNRNKLGPSTQAIVNEASRRNIPWMRLNTHGYIQFGYGRQQQKIQASITGKTSNISVDIAGSKEWTKQVLAAARIPVPEGMVISTEADLQEAVKTIGLPVVIKPLNGNQGKGVTTHVRTRAELKFAFNKARQYGNQIVCEKHITGNDYRVLVIDNRFVAAAKRLPALVTGDGIHTINELIARTNAHCLRGDEHDNYLTRITVDETTNLLLQKQNVTLDTIPAPETIILLKPTANLSTGGTATDITMEVHPDNIALFERAARLIGLDVCGIDVMAESLRTRLTENGGAILEVNAAPGLRMHLLPSAGPSRNVAEPIIDMLFPENASGRIPLFAVTGTNGKTTTTRLIAGILKAAGYYTGYTTTDGIYIGDELITKGDCSGPVSARLVLQDPAVEAAVLECARGGILRSGLGFDSCDVAVITNIAEDHLGLDGIDTIKDLARVKSVVAKSVKKTGTAVLNADNEFTPGIMKELDCNIALFSLSEDNPVIKAHVQAGGMALTFKDHSLILYRDHQAVCLEAVNNIPCTFNGKATFNVANAMAAALACISYGLPLHMICKGLQQFAHSPEHTPGRMNLFSVNGYTVLLDYAHNPHGLQAIGDFISQLDFRKKIGIITGVGDRRDQDIIRIGEEAAKVFDEIIIRQDDDLRGRADGEVDRLIRKGIHAIAPGKPVVSINNEKSAIEFGLAHMLPDYLLVMFVDHVWEGIDLVKAKLKEPAVRQMNSSIAV